MNEANFDVADGRPLAKHEPAAPDRKYDDADDRMTSRLPPVPRPPHMPGRPPSQAPAAPHAILPSVEISARTIEVHPPPQTSTSGWRSLLTSALPPATGPWVTVPEARVAWACGSLAMVLLVSGLVVGLWVGSSQLPPVVAAATVLGRALVSLGMLGFGLSLVGVAERIINRGNRGNRLPEDSDGKRF